MSQSIKEKSRIKNIKNHILGKEEILLDNIKVSFSYEIFSNNKHMLQKAINDYMRDEITILLKNIGRVYFLYDFKVHIFLSENTAINSNADKKYHIDFSVFAKKGRSTYKNSIRIGSLSFIQNEKRFLDVNINDISEIDLESLKIMFHFTYYNPASYIPFENQESNILEDFILFENSKLKIFENTNEIGYYLEENQIGLREENDALENNNYKDISNLSIELNILLDSKTVEIVLIKDEYDFISKEYLEKGIEIKPHESIDIEMFLAFIYDNNFLGIKNIFDKEDFVKNFELSMETYKTIKY